MNQTLRLFVSRTAVLYKFFLLVIMLNGINIPRSYAQDIHYTQYQNSPLYLNPANSGYFKGDWRITGNYRTQWRSISVPYQTLSASYDQNFFLYGKEIGAGLFIIDDQSGEIGFHVQKIYASGSYKTTFSNHHVNVGLQLGIVHKSFNLNDMLLPEQYSSDLGSYDPTLPVNYEGDENIFYPDLNIGALWHTKIGRFEPEAGISFMHLNRPNQSFEDKKEPLPVKLSLYAQSKYDINPRLYIEPSLLFVAHKKANSYIMGINGGYKLPQNPSNIKAVNGGLLIRTGFGTNADAMAITGGFRIGRIDIGVSYDLNVSPLNEVSNYRGAFELSFAYRSISTILNSYSIPCERL